jgi:hypothetical protein
MNSSIKMEVGIEDCLHIEFEYNRSKYHLKDVVIGKIYFLLVRLKIKHMEIEIRKRLYTFPRAHSSFPPTHSPPPSHALMLPARSTIFVCGTKLTHSHGVFGCQGIDGIWIRPVQRKRNNHKV